jgi:DNA adenine methylase
MPSTYTPLRYPGGKAKLGSFLSDLLKKNHLEDATYAEPYAGGAGAALYLLFRGYAKRVHLNDIDPAVASFWRSVLTKNAEFVRKIETVPLSVKEWDRQRQIYMSKHRGFDLGFAFFYLNRTNRSGIMNGGIIGGRAQDGEWLIDARFNRVDLAERVSAIGGMRRHISVSETDALEFLSSAEETFPKRSIVYLDPPYYGKGRDLYTNFYTSDDHAAIARRMTTFKLPWVMTYDDCHPVRQLYSGFRIRESSLSYSAREVRRGRELVIFGKNIRVPSSQRKSGERGGFELL